MDTATFLSAKIRVDHCFSHKLPSMVNYGHKGMNKITISPRRGVIRCHKGHHETSLGSAAKLEITNSSDNGAVVQSVNGSLVRKSNSVAKTKKADPVVSEEIGEISSFVRSTNLQILDEDMTSTLPKTSERYAGQLQPFKGLGIVDFLKDKNFLITGVTGFFAKVLIEKILRMQPEVGKIFVIIKAKDHKSALQRLKHEVIYSDLFKGIQETYGNQYEDFMLQKLIPVTGDVTRDKLGIEPDMAKELLQEVDIVLNSAATTTFDERYDVALEINTKGTRTILEFARCCKRLQLFVQISTAYVNGERQGRVLEKPFHMGDTIAGEKATLEFESAPILDIEAEFELANKMLEDLKKQNPIIKSNGHIAPDAEKHLVQTMKELGLERAQTYGWQDAYVFTKAMGEMLIDNGRGDLPVVIIRPSVIESTYSDPFPGWIEGNRMMDPILLYYGKGQMCGFLADPNGVLDVVPGDMVANATIAAMAKHARNSSLEVYHVGSSVVNPLLFGDIAEVASEYFKSNPYVNTKGKPITVKKMQLFTEMEDFSSQMWSHLSNEIINNGNSVSSQSKVMSEKHKRICAKSIEQAKHLANIYKPYTFYEGRFDNSNTQSLYKQLSEEEKRSFNFDVSRINWRDYILKTHIPGLRQHVMKGRGTKMV